MILEAKRLERLSINKIERLLGVDGTIYKAYKAGEYPKDPNLISKLIKLLNIRQEWWDTDWESGNMDVFSRILTREANEAAIPQKKIEALKDFNFETLKQMYAGVQHDLAVAREDRDIARKERDDLKRELDALRKRATSSDDVK